MLNQAIKFNGLLLLFVAMLFASCEKDSLFEENFTSGDFENLDKKGKRGHKDCFDLVYPVTIVFPDETLVDVADKDDFKDAIRAWKADNPDATERPQLLMPYDVTLEDGTTVTIEDEATIQAIKEDCRPNSHGGHGHHRPRCFKPILPVTLNFPDGTSAEATDAVSFKDLLVAWKADNPDATERPNIEMPYDVELKDETIITIESEEDLIALYEDCRGAFGGHHHGQERCFTLNFPVTVNFPDGSTATAASKSALRIIKKTWYENNANAEEKPSLAFPLSVTMKEDGSTVTLNSIEELVALKEACED